MNILACSVHDPRMMWPAYCVFLLMISVSSFLFSPILFSYFIICYFVLPVYFKCSSGAAHLERHFCLLTVSLMFSNHRHNVMSDIHSILKSAASISDRCFFLVIPCFLQNACLAIVILALMSLVLCLWCRDHRLLCSCQGICIPLLVPGWYYLLRCCVSRFLVC